jgi:phosphogluconate dehydratase
MLGVCDKIVPGLMIGALSFGHLPTVFVPAGPMKSGLPNGEKAKVRQLHAEGKVGREELLEAEAASYHSRGTCTFYGTANSNQLLLEVMGLHLPGASFTNPDTSLRDALTRAAATRVTELALSGGPGIGELVDERTIVNACVALLASGGSTNHTMHLVAMARAAGIQLTWDDFSDLSAAVPLLARVYPNGSADVNHFHAAGGIAFLVRTLLEAGLLHEDVQTILGRGLSAYCSEPVLDADGDVVWQDGPTRSYDERVLRYQGPAANGMPELHKLTPALGVLQDRGHRVAIVTDGRMSGASGKVPAAIHVTPEAALGGPLARVRDGDVITVDAVAGTLSIAVDAAELARREPTGGAPLDVTGTGRELFASFRAAVGSADTGASVFPFVTVAQEASLV